MIIDKCAVMHCGSANEPFNYSCDDIIMKVVKKLNDLSITRSQKLPIAEYKVSSIIAKANRMVGSYHERFVAKIVDS